MNNKIIARLIENYQLIILLAIILGLVIWGIFGVIITLLLASIIGIYYGKKSIWKPCLISSIIIGSGIIIFIAALSNSNM